MDTHYIGQLLLSMAIFAPGLVMLAGLAFIGVLMLVERAVLRGKDDDTSRLSLAVPQTPASNPPPDRIVSALKDAAARETAGTTHAQKPEQRQRGQ